jgi:Fe-S cluster biogenesis protein NfuA
LTSSLPEGGLFARWRTEFINPTVCPIRLCHGSCKRSSMSCRSVKTKIDSLLDAYIPEEEPVEALLNFRCCAGFTDD